MASPLFEVTPPPLCQTHVDKFNSDSLRLEEAKAVMMSDMHLQLAIVEERQVGSYYPNYYHHPTASHA